MEPNELKNWLALYDMRPKDLGAILGISAAQVYAWLNGSRRIPLWFSLIVELYERRGTSNARHRA
jgi:hypothetical protein